MKEQQQYQRSKNDSLNAEASMRVEMQQQAWS